MRISTSGEPPGAEGMMKRTGFSGYTACAENASADRMTAQIKAAIVFIRAILAS